MDVTKDKWEVRKECQITYYVELGNDTDTGIVSVFTDNPEKTKEVAKLIAFAPNLKQQRDDLIALIWKLNPKHRHDQDYFLYYCTLCGMEKICCEKIEAAIAKCKA